MNIIRALPWETVAWQWLSRSVYPLQITYRELKLLQAVNYLLSSNAIQQELKDTPVLLLYSRTYFVTNGLHNHVRITWQVKKLNGQNFICVPFSVELPHSLSSLTPFIRGSTVLTRWYTNWRTYRLLVYWNFTRESRSCESSPTTCIAIVVCGSVRCRKWTGWSYFLAPILTTYEVYILYMCPCFRSAHV